MAEGETVTTGGATEIVHKFVTEPVEKIVKDGEEAGEKAEFDPQRFGNFYRSHKEQVDEMLGITALQKEVSSEREARLARDMENAKLKAQNAYGFTDEELAEIPGATAEDFAKAAAVAGKYKAQAVESSKVIEQARERGTMPSELGGAASPDVPKEGTPAWHIYQLRKAQGLVK